MTLLLRHIRTFLRPPSSSLPTSNRSAGAILVADQPITMSTTNVPVTKRGSSCSPPRLGATNPLHVHTFSPHEPKPPSPCPSQKSARRSSSSGDLTFRTANSAPASPSGPQAPSAMSEKKTEEIYAQNRPPSNLPTSSPLEPPPRSTSPYPSTPPQKKPPLPRRRRRLSKALEVALYDLDTTTSQSLPIIMPWDRRSTSSDSLYRFPTPDRALRRRQHHRRASVCSSAASSLGVPRADSPTIPAQECFVGSRQRACPLCGRSSPARMALPGSSTTGDLALGSSVESSPAQGQVVGLKGRWRGFRNRIMGRRRKRG
ncbi:hypothetical protein K505DRAFT_421540 [Melanomma pulvis-pyrius CBS 109.77]|uniref:Uncharacterized protein n=1 Tax=Melanomma pulvis-pyrius CBS 109.77 TaxID=1314802 RepID=A0A6A6WVA0_9PLEO|nr:hypothetical protein K505DRAFT_421540 [Melanomma pulvis-pyrius CBS 109.77]